tara:strand:+ start:27574 stop:27849 length:276 start_codon:yes stop_codon:yes gene_type:complete
MGDRRTSAIIITFLAVSIYVCAGIFRYTIFKNFKSFKRELYSAVLFFPIGAVIWWFLGTLYGGDIVGSMFIYSVCAIGVIVYIIFEHYFVI